jgi:hypothetical protein
VMGDYGADRPAHLQTKSQIHMLPYPRRVNCIITYIFDGPVIMNGVNSCMMFGLAGPRPVWDALQYGWRITYDPRGAGRPARAGGGIGARRASMQCAFTGEACMSLIKGGWVCSLLFHTFAAE